MLFIRPCQGRITSHFNLKRKHPIYNTIRPHWGTDFGNHSDNTIVAAQSGAVRVVKYGNTGFGNYIIITHDNGWETLYAHLRSIAVKVGQKVGRAQYIGVKGTTGDSTGVHLHFELSKGRWSNQYKHHVNPVGYIDDDTIALNKGVNGPRVKRLQENLNKLGFKLLVDGDFGDKTEQAVKDYQRKNRLTVDGSVGPATVKSILDSLKKPIVKPPKKEVVKEKEVDEMTQFLKEKLPQTQRIDYEKLFKWAHKEGYFQDDHSGKVKDMTRKQVYDLEKSLEIRVYLKEKEEEKKKNQSK